jgi:hypothetical protein
MGLLFCSPAFFDTFSLGAVCFMHYRSRCLIYVRGKLSALFAARVLIGPAWSDDLLGRGLLAYK